MPEDIERRSCVKNHTARAAGAKLGIEKCTRRIEPRRQLRYDAQSGLDTT